MQTQENAFESNIDLAPFTDAVQGLFASASSPDEITTFRDDILQNAVQRGASSRKEELILGKADPLT